MKVNNELISKTIYKIIDVFKSLPETGFCLHIEDKAQEGVLEASVGKKDFGITVRHLKEDELPPDVKARLRPIGTCSIADEIFSAFEELIQSRESTRKKVKGFTAAKEAVDPCYDGEVYDFITIFYVPHIEMAKDIDELEELIKNSVRHEWRHAMQFNWLRSHGINPCVALAKEDETIYGMGPLEKDAHEFGKGIETDINIAMSVFLQ